MPVPPCFHLADDVFPRVRATAAQHLAARGWSQSRIAGALGVSQAMVSKYQSRPPHDDALVLRLTEELLDELATPTPGRHGPSPWCATLTAADPRPGADEALADLLAAERRLLEAAPLHLMPQVGLNLARALTGAASPDDVLAYPARIVSAGDRLVRPAPPALGASRHLATCLLALAGRDPAVRAIANIRGGPTVRAAARAVGTTIEITGDAPREQAFGDAVAAARAAPRLIHDAGAVGIEPCLYVAGDSATAVVDLILRLATKVTP